MQYTVPPPRKLDLETGATQTAEKITNGEDLAEHGFHIDQLAWMREKHTASGKVASLEIWFHMTLQGGL
jgi:hypothetical protein